MIGDDPWLSVAVGGALGALARWAVYRGLARVAPPSAGAAVLWNGTLLVNGLGSLLLGGLAGRLVPTGFCPMGPLAPSGLAAIDLHALATVGLCGALTTFSTLCADAVGAARRDGARWALFYLGAHAVVAWTAIRVGLALAG